MIEKFKRWLAEHNFNNVSDKIAREDFSNRSHLDTRENLKNYLSHKSPFGGVR